MYIICRINSIFKLKIINCILFGFSLQGHKTRSDRGIWNLVKKEYGCEREKKENSMECSGASNRLYNTKKIGWIMTTFSGDRFQKQLPFPCPKRFVVDFVSKIVWVRKMWKGAWYIKKEKFVLKLLFYKINKFLKRKKNFIKRKCSAPRCAKQLLKNAKRKYSSFKKQFKIFIGH